MSKKLFWLSLSVLFLGLFIPIILRLLVTKETATVKFKEPIIEITQPGGVVVRQDELFGEVTKKDRYVVVKTEDEGKELVFTWDQIKSITESRQARSKQVDELVDWIEFVSRMGIIAAIIIFLVGLYQYQQGQKWKREEFLATANKEFMSSLGAGNARLMLEALRLYKNGISIKFDKDSKKPVKVSREEILDALDTDTDREFSQAAMDIRDCFDSYFNQLEKFEHYIHNDLVSKDSVYTYLNYQIHLLSEGGNLKDEYRQRILKYADFFDFPGIKALLNRYKKELQRRKPSNQSSSASVSAEATTNDELNTDMNNAKHSFIRIAGMCSVLAPFVLLIGDAILLIGNLRFEWTIALWVAFVLFVPAIFGLTYLAAGQGSRLALVGGASAFFGCMAGASMQVLFRVWAVLNEVGSPQTVELLRSSRKLIVSTQMIGIFFPIGLLILAASLYRRHIVSPIIPISLAIGAILFPIGRIAGLLIGVLGSDLLFLIAFGMIGSRLLSARTGELE